MVEVGDYIRTKGHIFRVKGLICKGYPIKRLEGFILCDDEDGSIVAPKEVKYNKNILDLIEERRYSRMFYKFSI